MLSTFWDVMVIVGISVFLWSVADSLKRIADATSERRRAESADPR